MTGRESTPAVSQQRTSGEHGMTRRQLMRHAAWFGAAVVLTVTGGEVISHIAGRHPGGRGGHPAQLRFVQVSDSHLGFKGAANLDVAASFGAAIDQVNSLGFEPDFVMHSGDITHLRWRRSSGRRRR